MSNYHILEASDKGNSLRVVMHIAVPVQTNLANKTLSSCIIEDPSKVKTSILASVTTAEINGIAAGTLVEYVISVRTHKDIPNITKRNRLDAAYNKAVIKEQNALRQRYWGWGFERNIV